MEKSWVCTQCGYRGPWSEDFGTPLKCPVTGCGGTAEERTPRKCFTPSVSKRLAELVPGEGRLKRGDEVLLKEGQSVCLRSADGTFSHWHGQHGMIGLGWGESDRVIPLSGDGEERLIFVDRTPFRVSDETEEILILPYARVRWKYELEARIEHPERFVEKTDCSEPGQAEGTAKALILEQLQSGLKAFYLRCGAEELPERFADREALETAASGETGGIVIKRILFCEPTVNEEICPTCGAELRNRLCPNRHTVLRCPSCDCVVYGAAQSCCRNGHALTYCSLCGKFIRINPGREGCSLHGLRGIVKEER